MALINCPDCNTEVSDRAVACPRCACPIASVGGVSVIGTRSPQVIGRAQVIEATAKRWKRLQLIGSLLILGSLTALVVAAAMQSAVSWLLVVGSMVAAVTGLGTLITGSIGAWWHHG